MCLAAVYAMSFIWVLLTSSLGFTRQFDDIIAFGDSLTDVGNVSGLTEPGVPPRINGYFLETHFSDNLIWIEILANFLELPPRTTGRGITTTLVPIPTGNTWAWGGSEAAYGSVQPPGVIEPIPNLITEVVQYLSFNVPSRNTLYAIWSGADNLLIGDNFTPEAAKQAVEAVIVSMRLLEKDGARHFLIFNMPNLADTPAAQAEGPLGIAAANIYATSYNKSIKRRIRNLQKDPNFKANIYFVNTYSELTLAVNTVKSGKPYTPHFFVPGPKVVITDVTDEAIGFFDATGIFPTNYLFWDDVHPTTQGHQVIAGLALKAIRPCR